MTQDHLLDPPTEEERLDAESEAGQGFGGNLEHLVILRRVLNSPMRSDLRRDALAEWSGYNTVRTDSAFDARRGVHFKTTYREHRRGLDLRGLNLGGIVGPIDLRGADLRGAVFTRAALTKARFDGADLRGARFDACCLRGASFKEAELEAASFDHCLLGFASFREAGGATTPDGRITLVGADLQGADLSGANLRWASLVGANLQVAQIIDTDLRGADLTSSQVFGAAVWSPLIDDETRQGNLLVTPAEPIIRINDRGEWMNVVQPKAAVSPMTSDSLEHAHLIHLMLNPDLSFMLETMTAKGVLLLGRFTGDTGRILDMLRVELRERGLLPLKFDFRRPRDRTLKETVLTLAGFCSFVVADITDASSVPFELSTIVKDYQIPVVPICRKDRQTFSMFSSIDQEYRDRVLSTLVYEDETDLSRALENGIIQPALALQHGLIEAKGWAIATRSTADYL